MASRRIMPALCALLRPMSLSEQHPRCCVYSPFCTLLGLDRSLGGWLDRSPLPILMSFLSYLQRFMHVSVTDHSFIYLSLTRQTDILRLSFPTILRSIHHRFSGLAETSQRPSQNDKCHSVPVDFLRRVLHRARHNQSGADPKMLDQ